MESLKRVKNNSKDILVIGAGGHGKEIASYIQDLMREGERINLLGFIDEGKPAGPFADSKILGNFDTLSELIRSYQNSLYYLTAVGDNETRKKFVKKIESLNASRLKVYTLIHPKALLGQGVDIGEGTCLCPGSIITTRVKLGKHCIVNVNASVSHDCEVQDFVNINPGSVICGNVKIGEGSYIGAGAAVIDNVSIGEWTVIGAGAVVTQDIPPHVTAVGVPAKVIKKNCVSAL